MVMNPIPGEAGTDYPVFTEGANRECLKTGNDPLMPPSAGDWFQLWATAVLARHLHGHSSRLPGLFAFNLASCDTSLQPFYMCEENGRSTAFLCPNGTIFNQQYFVCDW